MRFDCVLIVIPQALTLNTGLHNNWYPPEGDYTPSKANLSKSHPQIVRIELIQYWLACLADLCHILAQRHWLRRFVEPQQFSKLQNKCRQSFHQLQAESEKTLNCLAVVRRFLDSQEARTALVFQLDNEHKAQL